MARQAFDITANHLTAALISGDFDAYLQLISLPLQIIPDNGAPYSMHSQAELRADFDLYHNGLIAEGVTDIFRQVLDFQEQSPDLAIARCLTHIMANAHRLVEPFETHFHLRRAQEDWRISAIKSSAGHISWSLGRASITAAGQFTPTEYR